MFSEIRFRDYKVLRDTALPLSPFTLLIGPNGSGKSTALEALRTLADAEPRSQAGVLSLGSRAKYAEVVLSGAEAFAGCTSVCTWSPDGSTTGARNTAAATARLGVGGERWRSKVQSIRLYDPSGDAIASPAKLIPAGTMGRDGSGLVVMLDQLRDGHPERYDAAITEFCDIMPEFDNLLFDTPSEGIRAIMLRTRDGQHALHATSISRGTLLVLALVALAHSPVPPALICLEEPDRGLHPRLIRRVKEALERLAYPADYHDSREPVQILATTHSPVLLDLFRDSLDQVIVACRKGLRAEFRPLDSIDHFDEIMGDEDLSTALFAVGVDTQPTSP